MNRVIRHLQIEKTVLFPAGLSLLWLAWIGALQPLLARIGLPRLPVLLSVLWFTAGYLSGLRREKSGKRLSYILELFLTVLLWIGVLFLTLTRAGFRDGLLFRDLWPFWGLMLLALLAWRSGAFFFALIRLPFLVPLKREQLEDDFHTWLHNYMQGHSARRSVTRARRAVLLLLFGTAAAHAVALQTGSAPGLFAFLSAAAGTAAGLTLVSTLYRLSVYTAWIVDGVHVQRDFFRIWFRFAAKTILALTLLVALLPLGMEILDREKVIRGVSGLLTDLNRSTSKDRDPATNRLDPDRTAAKPVRRPVPAEDGEPALKRVLRVTMYAGLVLLFLALTGGMVRFLYRNRYTDPPKVFRIPLRLWDILRKFLQILGYFLRIFFLAGYRKRERRSVSHIRQTLEELLPAAPELSDEKKREIRAIIEIYLRFVEEAGGRGFVFRRGETPREYRDRLTETLPEIKIPSGRLTGAFYRCRYSPVPGGQAVLDEAADALQGCLDVLSRLERTI